MLESEYTAILLRLGSNPTKPAMLYHTFSARSEIQAQMSIAGFLVLNGLYDYVVGAIVCGWISYRASDSGIIDRAIDYIDGLNQ